LDIHAFTYGDCNTEWNRIPIKNIHAFHHFDANRDCLWLPFLYGK